MPFPSFLDVEDRQTFVNGTDRFSESFLSTNGFEIEQIFLIDFYEPINYLHACFFHYVPPQVRCLLDPYYIVVGISELILNDGLEAGHQEIADIVYAQLISDMVSPEQLTIYSDLVVQFCVQSMDMVYDKMRHLLPVHFIENHSGYVGFYWQFAYRFSNHVAQFNLLKQI